VSIYHDCFRNGASIRIIERQNDTNGTSIGIHSNLFALSICSRLQTLGNDIHIQNKNGYTALHRACNESHLNIVKYHVEKGVNIGKLNEYGESPLTYAVRPFNRENYKVFIESWSRSKQRRTTSPETR
jgi:ankyrin repeat protein